MEEILRVKVVLPLELSIVQVSLIHDPFIHDLYFFKKKKKMASPSTFFFFFLSLRSGMCCISHTYLSISVPGAQIWSFDCQAQQLNIEAQYNAGARLALCYDSVNAKVNFFYFFFGQL